ncbi:MAG TPA: hypothetical protein VGC95_06830 [Chitinophagaceae bacterium]|jgi:hypothetical protein
MKKYFLGLVAILFAIGLFSFTKGRENPKSFAGEKWFVFNGVDPTDLGNASKYSLDGDGSTNTVCPSTSLMYRCEIKAVPQAGDPAHPNLGTIISQRKRATP